MTATGDFSGGCQCGAVRFHINGPLGKASICHCRMCQKAFGSWGAALVSVPSDKFKWTRGAPSEFRSSAIVARGFCAACGTPLYMHDDGDTNIEMAIGAFDRPNEVGPLVDQVGVESRLAWFGSMHKLPEKMTTDYNSPEEMLLLKSLQHPDHD
jgi:hypothetical protein